jgi:diketogulonate reductase-like aldo/keto reductase
MSKLSETDDCLHRAVDDPTIIALAKELGKSPAQVILSWTVQRGVVVLTKSVTPSRIVQNFQGML